MQSINVYVVERCRFKKQIRVPIRNIYHDDHGTMVSRLFLDRQFLVLLVLAALCQFLWSREYEMTVQDLSVHELTVQEAEQGMGQMGH